MDNQSIIYEYTGPDNMIVVPDYINKQIEDKLDQVIAMHPGASNEREQLRNTLLGFFSEYGHVPDFSIEKVE